MQPNTVHKHEAPRREAEHQISHQGACGVFRHRMIYVDARIMR
jgi:hypothetical protein